MASKDNNWHSLIHAYLKMSQGPEKRIIFNHRVLKLMLVTFLRNETYRPIHLLTIRLHQYCTCPGARQPASFFFFLKLAQTPLL